MVGSAKGAHLTIHYRTDRWKYTYVLIFFTHVGLIKDFYQFATLDGSLKYCSNDPNINVPYKVELGCSGFRAIRSVWSARVWAPLRERMG